MQLLASWKESLILLHPRNFKNLVVQMASLWTHGLTHASPIIGFFIVIYLYVKKTADVGAMNNVERTVHDVMVTLVLGLFVALASGYRRYTGWLIIREDGIIILFSALIYLSSMCVLGIKFPLVFVPLWYILKVIFIFFVLFLLTMPPWRMSTYLMALPKSVMLFVYNLPLLLGGFFFNGAIMLMLYGVVLALQFGLYSIGITAVPRDLGWFIKLLMAFGLTMASLVEAFSYCFWVYVFKKRVGKEG